MVKNAGDRHGFDPGVLKIPWRRPWQSMSVFWPGESYGQRSLVGYSVYRVAKSWTQLKRLSTHREQGGTCALIAILPRGRSDAGVETVSAKALRWEQAGAGWLSRVVASPCGYSGWNGRA